MNQSRNHRYIPGTKAGLDICGYERYYPEVPMTERQVARPLIVARTFPWFSILRIVRETDSSPYRITQIITYNVQNYVSAEVR